MRIKNLLFVALMFATLACKSPSATQQTATTAGTVVNNLRTPDWAKHAVIYEVNVRQFSKEGTFNAFAKDLPRLKDLGVDILWLMPIYPIAEKERKCDEKLVTECWGSHYAASDFETVNPKYGTMDDFKRLVSQAHAQGLKIILDFVPNHTGWDSKWMREHPDWFKKGPDGKITDPINPDGTKWGWTDVAQLDFSNPQMREAWMRVHEFWVKATDVDGFREDVAGAVPISYWAELRPRLDRIRPIFMLAENEDDGRDQFNACFNANYGWMMHRLLKDVAQGKKPASAIYEHTEDVKKRFGTRGWQMNFTQNHDENSWAGTERELFGNAGDCFTALCFMVEGMGLIYDGQEASLDKRLAFFNKDQIDWKGKSRAPFFKTLTKLKHENKALWNGQSGGALQKIATSDDAHVYAFTRKKGHDAVFCLFNLSKNPVEVTWQNDAVVGKWHNAFAAGQPEEKFGNQGKRKLGAFEYVIWTKD